MKEMTFAKNNCDKSAFVLQKLVFSAFSVSFRKVPVFS